MKISKFWMMIIVVVLATVKLNAQTNLNGATYSYADSRSGVTSYFTFTSPTDVAWYFGAPSRFMFPVGYGKYNAQNGTVTFSHEKPAHTRIALYYGDTDIIFDFKANGKNAAMRMRFYDEDLAFFYNNGGNFTATKELYSLKPDTYLVGTSWVCEYSGEKSSLYFKSSTEVLIDGETHLYVCLDNFVSITSGDNLMDESLVGTFTGNMMSVYRDGLAGHESDDNNRKFCFKRIE